VVTLPSPPIGNTLTHTLLGHEVGHAVYHARQPAISLRDALPKEIEEMIVKYGKDGLSPSMIGIKLRDQHAIPLVKPIINKGIAQVLDENKSSQEIPEDLNNIVMKAVGLQNHLKTNRNDNRNVRSLELIEAKVHRLSVYYKKIGRIPKTWKYKSVVAQLE
jgi:small subunit ribosomal protein S15